VSETLGDALSGEAGPSAESSVAPGTVAHAASALADVVRAHDKRLYRFVLRHIGNPTEAEDIAQQAFVEAARQIERFRGASELSTWLYGIAMNLVRNHLSRAPSRRYGFESEEALDNTMADTPDPQTQLEQSQMGRALVTELGELPNDMREVLLLVAMDELSYEEAAVMLSIPIGTVRSRVSRARSTLRRKLAERGIELPF
jgi:RNA polymerase sigma-70 factor (ECF subfamily)